MYGNEHKKQTQHMETANTHKACTRGVAKKMPNMLNVKNVKNMGEKKKDVVAGCKKKKKGKPMLKCAVCLKKHQNIFETHGNGKQHCSNA